MTVDVFSPRNCLPFELTMLRNKNTQRFSAFLILRTNNVKYYDILLDWLFICSFLWFFNYAIHDSLLVFQYNTPPFRNKHVNWVHASGLFSVSSQLPKQMNVVSYIPALNENMKAVAKGIYKGHLWPQGLTSLCNVSWQLL